MAAVIAGALVVMFGAFYAFGFAMAKLHKEKWIYAVAIGCFAALSASVYVLARSLNLDGYWQSVVYAMLIGYLVAPQAIWKLSVGTHDASE